MSTTHKLLMVDPVHPNVDIRAGHDHLRHRHISWTVMGHHESHHRRLIRLRKLHFQFDVIRTSQDSHAWCCTPVLLWIESLISRRSHSTTIIFAHSLDALDSVSSNLLPRVWASSISIAFFNYHTHATYRSQPLTVHFTVLSP